ncbi:MAG TPA: amidinotransferase [Thioalkalivibrio sp.]|nr:amidinotransferase [Thioalkalivibrio sp.]
MSCRSTEIRKAQAQAGARFHRELNPSSLDKPAFLMNVPFSLAADVPNNVWMEELDEQKRRVDVPRALNQFMQLYHYIAAEALVYLLPTPAEAGLQDLVYSANTGVVLEHLPEPDTVVLSNFATDVRRAETPIAERFFDAMGYNVVVPPHHFEGEAELKHLYDNVYIGGYGIRSERAAHEWLESEFDMQVVKLEETDPHLYHLDCTIFPLTRDDTLVCTEMYSRDEVAQIEKVTNIIDVSVDDCYSGVCNNVRLGNLLLNASNIQEMRRDNPDYGYELAKNRRLEDIAAEQGFEVAFFNLGEYLKSGALLSCMVMHLNRKSYDIALI